MKIETFKECYEAACDELAKRRYNVATMLYYKALTMLCDYYIEEETNKVVTNHTQRFGILTELNKDVFNIVSPMFKTYRNTYAGVSLRDDAIRIKNAVKKVAGLIRVEVD